MTMKYNKLKKIVIRHFSSKILI